MRYYELLYIINPNLEDERVKSIIEEVGNEVQKHNVNIINHHIWGKKRLAYAVKNNKYGIYILLQFGADQFDFLKEFERFLILSKSVIRHQIIKLEDEPKKVENIEAVVDDADENDESEDDTFDIPEEDSDDEVDDADDDEPQVEQTEELNEADTAEEIDNGEETKEEGK